MAKPDRKVYPYFIADAISDFTVSKPGFYTGSVDEYKIRAGDIIYVKKAFVRGGEQYWEIFIHNLTNRSFNAKESELINKIKVRKDENNKSIYDVDHNVLYEKYQKKKYDDIDLLEKEVMVTRNLNAINKIIEMSKERAKIEMPDNDKIMTDFFNENEIKGEDARAKIRNYLKLQYDLKSDDPYAYSSGFFDEPIYFKDLMDRFKYWISEKIKNEEIKANKNEQHLKEQARWQKIVSENRKKGRVPCQRCGGRGESSQWKYTGYTCYECDGAGWLDPLVMEPSGRERYGLPRDPYKCEKYLIENGKISN